jgi:hypothetical protein
MVGPTSRLIGEPRSWCVGDGLGPHDQVLEINSNIVVFLTLINNIKKTNGISAKSLPKNMQEYRGIIFGSEYRTFNRALQN